MGSTSCRAVTAPRTEAIKMPLLGLIHALNGTCRFCNQSAGFLQKQHRQCRALHAQGMREMTRLAPQAAGTASFNETALRNTLQAIATQAKATDDDISTAIAAGFAQGVEHAMLDGTLTHKEEDNLRTFRDRMADQELPAVATGSATLDRAARERIGTQTRRAALAVGDIGGSPGFGPARCQGAGHAPSRALCRAPGPGKGVETSVDPFFGERGQDP